MPSGIPYIVGNEAAERFSYYGMRAILVIFLTKYLMDSTGTPDYMSEAEANTWFHMFATAVYFFPLIGALISDVLWGKYKTILTLSIVYCLGHLTLALWETRTGVACGLALIAVGSGGIKPCVSAHVGDQFSSNTKSLIEKAFSWFYFAINFGAFFSILLTPILLDRVGPGLAFGVPGILMFIATIVFWMGRHKFVHVPPAGWKRYRSEVFSKQGLKAVLGLGVLYVFIAFFWALYDQQGSSWVLQANKLDRHVDLRFGPFQFDWLAFDLLPAQLQAVNPILIMIFIPLFAYVIYPTIDKFVKVTPLRKIGVGFFVTGLSFAVVAYTEQMIQAGQTPSMLWQFLAFTIITAGEVMISITALEFSYTQAPNAMKSIIMGVFLLSVSLGNFVTAMVNMFIQNPDGTTKLTGPEYFWFFTGLIACAGVLFVIAAKFYKEESYIQDVQVGVDGESKVHNGLPEAELT